MNYNRLNRNKIQYQKYYKFNLVFRVGFEPTTPTLSRQCSEPTELTEQFKELKYEKSIVLKIKYNLNNLYFTLFNYTVFQ